MNIVIDKPDYVVVKTSYGFFTNDEGIDYDLVEQDLMEIFVGDEK